MANDLFDTTPAKPQAFGAGRRPIAVQHHVSKQYGDFEYVTAEAVLDLKPGFARSQAAAVMAQPHCAHAAIVRQKLKLWDKKPPDVAVYVIGTDGEDINKIGVSSNPFGRCEQIGIDVVGAQVKAMIWVYGRQDAYRLEAMAHRIATRGGAHIKGEWFLLNVETACSVLIEAARSIAADVADSKTALHNWRLRADAFRVGMDRMARLPTHVKTVDWRWANGTPLAVAS